MMPIRRQGGDVRPATVWLVRWNATASIGCSSPPAPATDAVSATCGGAVALSAAPAITSSKRISLSARRRRRPPPTSSTSPLRSQVEPAMRAPLCSTTASAEAGCRKSCPSWTPIHASGPETDEGRTMSLPAPPIDTGNARSASRRSPSGSRMISCALKSAPRIESPALAAAPGRAESSARAGHLENPRVSRRWCNARAAAAYPCARTCRCVRCGKS